jgi:hypothetical protein
VRKDVIYTLKGDERVGFNISSKICSDDRLPVIMKNATKVKSKCISMDLMMFLP